MPLRTYRLALQDGVKHRQNICRCLSRTSLCLCKYIMSLQCQRDGLALHERGFVEILTCDGLEQSRVQSELGKRRFWFGFFSLLDLRSRRRCVVGIELALHHVLNCVDSVDLVALRWAVMRAQGLVQKKKFLSYRLTNPMGTGRKIAGRHLDPTLFTLTESSRC
jgi:hypothetical protein